MRILLNGQLHDLEGATTLAALLERAGYAARRVAVEINREIVPRSEHAARSLREGDRVEVVQAMGGG